MSKRFLLDWAEVFAWFLIFCRFLPSNFILEIWWSELTNAWFWVTSMIKIQSPQTTKKQRWIFSSKTENSFIIIQTLFASLFKQIYLHRFFMNKLNWQFVFYGLNNHVYHFPELPGDFVQLFPFLTLNIIPI